MPILMGSWTMRGDPVPVEFASLLPATLLDVRAVLQSIACFLEQALVDGEAKDAALISLGEALNNIVEHAYEEQVGSIEVHLRLSDQVLDFRITDWGRPMPGEKLPDGDLPDNTAETQSEGGYGWFLIRSLAQDLGYQRSGASNVLTFSISVKQ